MFVPLFLLGILLIAILRGGQLRNLRALDTRYIALFFVPLLLQVLAFSPLGDLPVGDLLLARVLYTLSLGCAALALWFNRRLPGALWIAAGLALNFVVIALNGGFMPVSSVAREIAGLSPVIERSMNIVPMTESTLVPWLGDILPLPRQVPFATVFSIGDIFILIGATLFLQSSLVRETRRT